MLVYDVRYKGSKTEPCPIFSTGHGEGHGEDSHIEHGNTTNSHDYDQAQHHGTKIPKDEIYMRPQLFPSDNNHKTFFVWATDAIALSTIIGTFNSTALICPQKIDGGVFHLQTR